MSQSSTSNQGKGTFNGQILFAPWETTTTYLMDSSGTINHTWPSTYPPFTEAYWLGDGSIMRPIDSGQSGLQRIRWDGTLAWDYRYTASGCTCHHDVKCLPNGDVLMIVWVTKTRNQAIQAGRDPSTISGNTFIPDKIIEVKPTGPTTGDVVWEWNVWDHLVQDFDSTKDNYGDVSEHPELIDINFGDAFTNYDWLHTNSLDYDPTFDQILVDVHNFDEVWVIDHSTTTEEAAGHTGGHYGHGGDLLYRWGNPQSYRRGTAADEILFWQHDAVWIKPGYPGAGHIMVFNNGFNRPGLKYSTVDEFAPPIDSEGNYYLAPGAAYGPENLSWRFIANPPTNMYSDVFGGAIRLMDGNTLICDGIPGKFLEVTPDNNIVWQYTNPYPSPSHNDVFKIDYVAPEEPPNPPMITGPSTTNAQVPTTFNFTTMDPNGDDVKYFVDWGDHTNSSWLGPYPSGYVITAAHAWAHFGQYTIIAKAKDSQEEESNWSNPFTIFVAGAELDISIVPQGTGVSAVLKNVGTLDATNITWRIQVKGGILGRINKIANGTIDIPVGNSTRVGTGMFFGFGHITVTVTAAGTTKSAQGVYLVFISRMR